MDSQLLDSNIFLSILSGKSTPACATLPLVLTSCRLKPFMISQVFHFPGLQFLTHSFRLIPGQFPTSVRVCVKALCRSWTFGRNSWTSYWCSKLRELSISLSLGVEPAVSKANSVSLWDRRHAILVLVQCFAVLEGVCEVGAVWNWHQYAVMKKNKKNIYIYKLYIYIHIVWPRFPSRRGSLCR